MVNLQNDWNDILKDYFNGDEYAILRAFLIKEYSQTVIYPDMYDIFNALKATSFKDTKVLILGQDPYHNPGEAHGMCFSVRQGVKIPPSLKNIYKELNADVGTFIPNNGCLNTWAENGVLLLNSILTVRENSPLSHKGKGWERLTDNVIAALNNRQDPVIFMLWGTNARNKKALITNKHHFVLEAPHPSPLSAHYGFFGCKHFSKANEILKSLNKTPIDWQIQNV